MKILALEAYYGGSHQAFLDGWSGRSGHEWTVLTLPAYKWKWRMRHSAVTLAEQVAELVEQGGQWDVLFASDMLNLAEFLGLAPESVRKLPRVVYFHENQLTYPVQFEDERDYQFVMTNLTTALAADALWFNSAYHRDAFLDGLPGFLKKMPDHQPFEAVHRLYDKARICPPGIEPLPPRRDRAEGPVRILWAARWEHDKNPETFFDALKAVKKQGVDFRLSAIGEQFRDYPTVFNWGRYYFDEQIDRWGYQETRAEYEQALIEADVFVSSAVHEFFGISAVEAMAAGAFPLLPDRLSYPEIMQAGQGADVADYFYDGSVEHLTERLIELAQRVEKGRLWPDDPDRVRRMMEPYHWDNLAPKLDEAIE